MKGIQMLNTLRRHGLRQFVHALPHVRYCSVEQAWSALRRFFPSLSVPEQQVSLALYSVLLRGRAITIETLSLAAGLEAGEVTKILSRWPGLYRDARGRVTGYWGMSILETPHRIAFGEYSAHACCAWDALFIPHVLGVAAQVQSRCALTGAPIALEVGAHGVESAAEPPVVSLILPRTCDTAAEVARKLTRFVHFFVTPEAACEWIARHPGTCLMTLDAAWELGRRRNEARYRGRWESSLAPLEA
jgi:alkylmercury lyase